MIGSMIMGSFDILYLKTISKYQSRVSVPHNINNINFQIKITYWVNLNQLQVPCSGTVVRLVSKTVVRLILTKCPTYICLVEINGFLTIV